MIQINGVSVLDTTEELVDPRYSAVIVIDMQNEVASKKGGYAKHGVDVSNLERLIPKIAKFLDAARERRMLVAYTQFIHTSATGKSLMAGSAVWLHRNEGWISDVKEGSWEGEMVEELTPRKGEVVIQKSRASALYNTYLSDLLRINSVRSVLLTGALSHGCVLKSAVDFEGAGFYPVIVKDCVGSYDAKDDDQVVFPFMRRKWPVFESSEIISTWNRT